MRCEEQTTLVGSPPAASEAPLRNRKRETAPRRAEAHAQGEGRGRRKACGCFLPAGFESGALEAAGLHPTRSCRAPAVRAGVGGACSQARKLLRGACRAGMLRGGLAGSLRSRSRGGRARATPSSAQKLGDLKPQSPYRLFFSAVSAWAIHLISIEIWLLSLTPLSVVSKARNALSRQDLDAFTSCCHRRIQVDRHRLKSVFSTDPMLGDMGRRWWGFPDHQARHHCPSVRLLFLTDTLPNRWPDSPHSNVSALRVGTPPGSLLHTPQRGTPIYTSKPLSLPSQGTTQNNIIN